MNTVLDAAIEKGIVFLLIFTPLAFGAVQQWSISVMEITSFSILCLVLIKMGPVLTGSRSLTPLFIMFAALICLIFFQMLSLPDGLLQVVSPSSLGVYREFGNYVPGALHSVSVNPYATTQELLKLFSYGAVFFIVVSHFRTKAQVHSLVKTIVYMGCFLAVFAIVQKLTWNGRVFWFYPLNESLRTGSGIWGPYINRNHFAGYMEMAIPLGLGLLIYWAPYIKALPGVPIGKKVARFLSSDNLVPFTIIFLSVLVMAAALVMTLSRGGMAAFGLSFIFFAWITQKRRSLRNRTVMLGLLAVVISVVLVFAAWEQIADRFGALEQERQLQRLKIWEDSLGIVRDYPIFGSGLGTFENTFMRYQNFSPGFLYDHAHNDYIEMLTDTGVSGSLIVGGMLSLFFLSVYKRWRMKQSMFGKCVGAGGLSSCVAISVHSFTDFNLHIPANALLFAVIAGITYAAVFNLSERNGSRADENRPTFPVSRFTSYAAFTLACLLIFFPVRELIADHYYRSIEDILDDKTTESLDVRPVSADAMPVYIEALHALETACRLSPSNARYHKALSELYDRLGRWAVAMDNLKSPLPKDAIPPKEASAYAVSHLEKAVSLEPTNPDYHLALGQLYESVQGDAARADAEFMRALKAFPVNAPLRYSVAMHFLLTGRKGDALEQARLLATLDDSYIMPESFRKTFMKERRTEDYLALLYNSYLFKALEIAWRASGDPRVVAGIAPDTADAREVVQAFMEWKGIEE